MVGSFPSSACRGYEEMISVPVDVASVVPGGVTKYAAITDQTRLRIPPEMEQGKGVYLWSRSDDLQEAKSFLVVTYRP